LQSARHSVPCRDRRRRPQPRSSGAPVRSDFTRTGPTSLENALDSFLDAFSSREPGPLRLKTLWILFLTRFLHANRAHFA
jgi:hypothetical protein